jgi:hypothetical protein
MITNTDLLPQRYHFLLGMVKDLYVLPFDNDMVPNFVYIMRKQFQYIKKTLFLLCILKIYHIDIILRPKLGQFVQFEISPSMSHKVFIFF